MGSANAARKAAGVSDSTWRNWRSGKYKPNAAALAKLKRAAGRLRSDDPASSRATAPALADPVAPAGDDAAPESADTDPRPRGLYVVGGQSASPQQPQRTVPPTQSAAGSDLPGWMKKAKALAQDIKPLTKAEAERLKDSTVRSFMQFWKYADEGISATNAKRTEAHIWSEIDREDTEVIVDLLIARGMESAAAAQVVRGISNMWNYYAVGLILGPRFYKTFKFYADNGGLAL